MRQRVLGWVAGFLCAACGGSESAPSAPRDAGVDQAGGSSAVGGTSGAAGTAGAAGAAGSSGSSGGGTGGGSDSGGAGGTGAVVGLGVVLVYQRVNDHLVDAYFARFRPDAQCTTLEQGVCRVERCIDPSLGANAGELAVSVGGVRRVVEQIEPGLYMQGGQGALWQPGDSVHVTATGGDAPAIDVTVTAPAPITLLEPGLDGGTGVVSRSRDLRLRWSGGTGTAAIGFTDGKRLPEIVRVKCSFDAKLGEGVVPAAVLSELTPGTTPIYVFTEDNRTWFSQGWRLAVAARANLETMGAATVTIE